jgi:hypothetical protein
MKIFLPNGLFDEKIRRRDALAQVVLLTLLNKQNLLQAYNKINGLHIV